MNLPYDLLTDENNILRKTFGIPNAMMVLPGTPCVLRVHVGYPVPIRSFVAGRCALLRMSSMASPHPL